jgi:protein ImuB
MRRMLCLHMPYLPTERARRDAEPAVEDERPLVLTRPVGSSLVVEQVCSRGRQLGLRPGLSLGQAQALAPELATLAYEPQRDRAALERLARWAARFSPLVEPVAPDTLLIDITGCAQLFGGESNIARQAVAGLAQQGFRSRAAIADTIGAAHALASAAAEVFSLAPAGQASAHLAPLPPAALRIEPQVAARLEALGLRSIGDVLMLPRATLPARFGAQLVLRLQQALGEIVECVTPYRPAEFPQARWPFENPVADFQTIAAVAEQLWADLFKQLQQRQAAVRRLECILYYERVPPRVLAIGLARASREQRHVATLLRQRLEPVDLTAGVTGLVLVARETACWHDVQGELFEPHAPGDDEALGCLIDRLAERLGSAAVLRPCLLDDHQPEMAFRYVGWALPTTGGESVGGAHPTRPVRLLVRPALIRVIALVPDGPPTWFGYRGREYVVVWAAGPERLETAWWRGPDIRRDYFRVTTETGEQFWIFHATNQREWYLHGIFA